MTHKTPRYLKHAAHTASSWASPFCKNSPGIVPRCALVTLGSTPSKHLSPCVLLSYAPPVRNSQQLGWEWRLGGDALASKMPVVIGMRQAGCLRSSTHGQRCEFRNHLASWIKSCAGFPLGRASDGPCGTSEEKSIESMESSPEAQLSGLEQAVWRWTRGPSSLQAVHQKT